MSYSEFSDMAANVLVSAVGVQIITWNLNITTFRRSINNSSVTYVEKICCETFLLITVVNTRSKLWDLSFVLLIYITLIRCSLLSTTPSKSHFKPLRVSPFKTDSRTWTLNTANTLHIGRHWTQSSAISVLPNPHKQSP